MSSLSKGDNYDCGRWLDRIWPNESDAIFNNKTIVPRAWSGAWLGNQAAGTRCRTTTALGPLIRSFVRSFVHSFTLTCLKFETLQRRRHRHRRSNETTWKYKIQNKKQSAFKSLGSTFSPPLPVQLDFILFNTAAKEEEEEEEEGENVIHGPANQRFFFSWLHKRNGAIPELPSSSSSSF